ncbi:MAG: reductive dehalogenase domain-containing protein [Desulfobacterales bacterium]|jgi:reductive dehalogenase
MKIVDTIIFLVLAGLIAQAAIGLSFLISSIRELEKRASVLAGVQFAIMAGAVLLFAYGWETGFLYSGSGVGILICLIAGAGLCAILFVKKSPANLKALQGTQGAIVGDVKRIDERDVVFARNRSIRPGTDQYGTYYQMRPEYEKMDAARREKGGPLGQPGIIDRPKDRPNIAATLSSLGIAMSLSAPETYQPAAHPEFKGQRVRLSPQEATDRVKGYTLNLGAKHVGITEINPLWSYSKRGEIFLENWEDWGKEIDVTHQYAIVFTTEMAFELVGTAPHTPTVISSMSNYAQGAAIASQLAAYIANMGYSATANHVRHYDAVLVPLAVDAGLGEVGRLGYLMTKDFGSRVRLAAVTTDLALIADSPVDIGVEDFCKICKKCAHCCPSNSIPSGEPTEVNGTLRWKLNAETCFDYWGKVGTDCNVCMRVCPWSHASSFPHKIIRALISRNRLSRRLFYYLDDIFYGRKPKPKPAPPWAQSS